MTKTQAKRLKAGDQVFWTIGKYVKGTVTRKKYNTVWIDWSDGLEKVHYAETMDYVFTQEQLDALAEENRVGEAVKRFNQGVS